MDVGKIIDFFRNFVESIGNKVEYVIWKKRQSLIFVGVCVGIIYPLIRSLLIGLESIKYETKEIKAITNYGTNIRIDEITDIYSISVGVIIFLIILEIFIRSIKRFSGTITVGDRIFASFAYLWSWTELTLTYFDYAVKFLSGIIEPAEIQKIIELFTPYFEVYTNLPGTKLGIIGYLAFFTFFYGIGRNKSTFKFFIRYHFIQSTLLAALFAFQGHLFFLFIKLDPTQTVFTDFAGTTVYSFTLLILACCFLSVILGLETYLPFMHDAIQYHTGRKEDEGKDPFNL